MPTLQSLIMILLLSLFLPTPARADDWGLAGRTASGASVYVDRHTLSRNGDVLAGSMRIVYPHPVELPQGASSTVRSTVRFRCADKTVAMEALVVDLDEAYNKMLAFKPLRRVGKDEAFSHESPGSPGYLAMQYACTQQDVPDVRAAQRRGRGKAVEEGDAGPRQPAAKGAKSKATASKPGSKRSASVKPKGSASSKQATPATSSSSAKKPVRRGE